MNGAGIATYVVCIFALVFCAVVSVWYTKFRSKKVVTADDFVTARGTASTWYIGWSFFATAVGSWIIVGPASYAPWAGIIGVVFYAVATGIPVLLIAALGAVIQRRHPHIVSLSDFIGKRWGYSAQTGVVILTLFNMGVGMTAEYTTIGALFKDFVGGKATPIIIIVGVLTMAYSAYGGLAVSIFTDQIQAIASLLLLFILVLYVAITLPGEKLGKLPEYLEGTNEVGYSSMFVMPASLCAATIFSEMFWQRVWASQDAHALKWGSIIGCTALIIMTFLLGFGGFLAAWAGFISWETTNPNLYLFQVFNQERDMDGNARVSSWVGVLTMLMAVIMNESALDSIQNGLVAAVSGQFLSKYHVNWSRAVCVLFNIPLMIIGTQQTLKVLSLFLITNMLTSCAAIPVAFALYKGRGHEYITGGGTIFSFFCGFICVSAYGISQTEGDFWDGMNLAWYANGYMWDYFLIAFCTSLGGMFVWAAFLLLLGLVSPRAGDYMKCPWREDLLGATSRDVGKTGAEAAELKALEAEGKGFSADSNGDVKGNGVDASDLYVETQTNGNGVTSKGQEPGVSFAGAENGAGDGMKEGVELPLYPTQM